MGRDRQTDIQTEQERTRERGRNRQTYFGERERGGGEK